MDLSLTGSQQPCGSRGILPSPSSKRWFDAHSPQSRVGRLRIGGGSLVIVDIAKLVTVAGFDDNYLHQRRSAAQVRHRGSDSTDPC